MADYVELVNTFRVITASVDPAAGNLGDASLAGQYDGPEVGENDNFRNFVNVRWTEAQARGHLFMFITRAVGGAPLTADDFPNELYELSRLLRSGDYEAAQHVLDDAEKLVMEADAPAEVIDPVFMCMRMGGVHVVIRYWLPAEAQVSVKFLDRADGAPAKK